MSDQAASAPAPQPAGEERSPSARQRDSDRTGGSRPRHRRRHQAGHQPGREPQRSAPEPAINMDELREVVDLIESHGFTEFELEREGFRIRLSRNAGAQSLADAPHAPASSSASVPHTHASQPATIGQSAPHLATPHLGAQAEAAASEDEQLHIIASPILGTFYRAASPTSEPFVRIGSHVEPDSVVCIIEAMKLMNEIQAEISGEVAKIYVENGQPVEYGQPLFGIKQ